MPDDKRPKRPRDINQLAFEIVQESTREDAPASTKGMGVAAVAAPPKNPAAVALGKLGASKGGKARAEKLSAEKRRAIAQKAAKSRWKKDD